MTDQEPSNLEELLDRIDETTEGDDKVTMDDILDVVGRRSFGPMLLLAGVITAMPVVGDIPGVPGIMGVFVVLIAGQLLLRREHLWLPQWILNRSVEPDKISTALEWTYPVARFVDGWLKPRMTGLTHATGAYASAITCIVIGAAMPAMEVVPFSANFAGLALTAFGLALIVHDGLVALLAFGFTLLTFGFVVYYLM